MYKFRLFKQIAFILFLFFCLTPNIKAQSQDQLISVRFTEYAFEDGQFIGYINDKKKIKYHSDKPFRDLGFPNILHHYVIEGLESNDIEALEEHKQKRKITGLTKPRVVIQAIIDSVYFHYSGKYQQEYAGYISLKGKWQLYSSQNPDEIVKSFPFKVTEERFAGSTEYILAPPLRLTAEKIGQNELFLKAVEDIEASYLIEAQGKESYLKTVKEYEEKNDKINIQRAIKAVYTLESKEGHGSAVLVSEDGHLLTNYHVIHEAKELRIISNSGEKFDVKVLKTNSDYDIALLQIEAEDLTPLKISTKAKVEVGENVFAIGTPLFSDLSQSVSRGIISGIRDLPYMKIIQTDVSISPGNSGGALMDANGELIGITTFKISDDRAEGIGFCIPIDEVIRALNLQFYP